MRARLKQCIPFAVAAGVVGAIFFQAMISSSDTYLFGWDMMDISYPFLQFFHNTVKTGTIPWWNPYIMGGHPYVGIVSVFIYPLFWLFAVLPVPNALTFYYAFHIFIAIVGMYRLMRRWVGMIPALFAGMTFGLSGFFFPRILTGVPDHIAAAAYLPLAIHGVFLIGHQKILKRALPGILETGFFWGLMVLVGDQRIGFMGALCIATTALAYVFKKKSHIPFLGVILAFFVGSALAASQLIPIVEYYKESIRSSTLSYEWASQGSVTVNDLKHIFYPLTKVFTPNTSSYPPYPEGPFYAGILPFILAMAGGILFFIRILRRRSKISQNRYIFLLFTLLGFFSIWIAMGPNAPFFDLYKFLWNYVPIYKAVRVPFRFVLIFIFSVAALSSLTLETIKNTTLRLILFGILLLELIPFARSFMILSPVPQAGYDAEVIQTMTSNIQNNRLHQNFSYTERLGRVIDFNAPVMYPFAATNGNWPFIIRNYADFFLSTAGQSDETYMYNQKQLPPIKTVKKDFLNMMSIRYVLSSGDFRPLNDPSMKLVIDNPYRWFTLYENMDAYPRYFPVYQAQYFSDREKVKDALEKSEYDLSKTVLLIGSEKPLNTCSNTGGIVTTEKSSVNEVRLDVSLPCDGYIVSSDIMYPGWTATVDGKRTQIHTANLAFRSVFVPKGTHTVVYRFIPLSVIAGIIISVLTCIAIAYLYFRKHHHI